MLHKLIFNLGLRLRSPELIEKYKFLKESEKWSIEELEKHQLKQLKRIVGIAYEKSYFYKEQFQELGIKPEDIKTLDDIKKLPIIQKKDLIQETERVQNKDNYRKLFYSMTGGSTGEQLAFYKNSEWDAGQRAAQFRGYSWYGVKPWESNGYFWGYSFHFKKKMITFILDTLVNRFRLFSFRYKDIVKFSKKLKKAAYLEGYSSIIYEVAKVINKHSLGPFNLKMIKGTSEKIYDSYQDEAMKAFGKKIISEYGATETGIIAYECPYGNMHITMENVIVEEDKGEAIITNLISDSFPLIRYRLGDSIILDNETICPCGMQHKIVKEVVGRIGKVIYGKQNKYPSLNLGYVFKNLTNKHNISLVYQAIQEKKGELIINIEKEITKEQKKKLLKECQYYFSDDMNILLFDNLQQRDFSGKHKAFISKVDEE